MVNPSSKSLQGATQFDASVSCKLWNVLNHEFSPSITKEMFIAYRFICSCSFAFLKQKGAGSSSFSRNLQRNHSIGGLQLHTDVSTDSCVSSSLFGIVNIINFIIHHIHSCLSACILLLGEFLHNTNNPCLE